MECAVREAPPEEVGVDFRLTREEDSIVINRVVDKDTGLKHAPAVHRSLGSPRRRHFATSRSSASTSRKCSAGIPATRLGHAPRATRSASRRPRSAATSGSKGASVAVTQGSGEVGSDNPVRRERPAGITRRGRFSGAARPRLSEPRPTAAKVSFDSIFTVLIEGPEPPG